MYSVGRFVNKDLAEACVCYVNKELVIPSPGFVQFVDGEYRLFFDGLQPYAVTRDKVYSAVQDFSGGWLAAVEYMQAKQEQISKKSKKSKVEHHD